MIKMFYFSCFIFASFMRKRLVAFFLDTFSKNVEEEQTKNFTGKEVSFENVQISLRFASERFKLTLLKYFLAENGY